MYTSDEEFEEKRDTASTAHVLDRHFVVAAYPLCAEAPYRMKRKDMFFRVAVLRMNTAARLFAISVSCLARPDLRILSLVRFGSTTSCLRILLRGG